MTKIKFHEKSPLILWNLFYSAFSSVVYFPFYSIPLRFIFFLMLVLTPKNDFMTYDVTALLWEKSQSPSPLPSPTPWGSRQAQSWVKTQKPLPGRDTGAGAFQRKSQGRNSFWPQVEKYSKGSCSLASPSSLKCCFGLVNQFPYSQWD